jgi:hypothetical protein
MYRLRLGVMALVVALFAGGWLMGDDPKGKDDKDPPAKIKGTLPKYWKKLGLSEEQVQKVYKIQADYQAKIAELDRKKEALIKEEKAEREKILTEAQKALLKEIILGETPKDKDKLTDKDKPAKDK